jgi:uncharacterized protein YcfJ
VNIHFHTTQGNRNMNTSQSSSTKLAVLSALTLAALAASSQASAQEVGRVLSSTPVVQQFAVPRQVCNTGQAVVQQPKSGAGAVIGAIAGGVVGNQVGRGSGNALATAIGLIGGAVVGNQIEGNGSSQVQNVTNCTTQTFYENRPVAYNVTYEYAGRQYQVQLPQDPGQTIPLQVTPLGASTQAPQQVQGRQPIYQQPTYQQPGYVQPLTQYGDGDGVIVAQAPTTVIVPGYVSAPYYSPGYAPIGLSLNLGYSRGYYGGHYGHRGYYR